MPSRRSSTLRVPKSILAALSLPTEPGKTTFSPHGFGSGFAATGHLVARVPASHDDDDEHADGGRQEHEGQEEEKHFFIKTSTKKSESCSRDASEMFRGEYESLNAIADVVPEMCPRPLAWGKIEPEDDDNSIEEGWFLATEFLDLHGGSGRVGRSLARRLAMLHNTAAPPPPVQTGPRVINVREGSGDDDDDDDDDSTTLQYGFPVPTFCGDVKQPNRFHRSWAAFYANQRLRTVLAESEKRNGPDRTLHDLVERVATTVVPRLLGDTHLGYDTNGNGSGIYPVVVHGDLWSGNAGRGTISRSSRMVPTSGPGEEVGDVIYDPAGCYAHSEFDLGIMHMFGGFGPDFYSEYHRLVPKTEPVHEYDDRVALYELYHHLNHHTIFGSGYRSSATSIMHKLLKKYAK